MYDTEFVKPTTIEAAVKALQTEDAQALGGGQTLIPAMKARLAAPALLVSLSGIPEMSFVRQEGRDVVIGGGTPHAVVARALAEVFPALSKLAGGIGDPAVRNRGTIGGSLANNDPAACYPAAVLACDAVICTNAREIDAGDFFLGMFETALDEGEIVTSVRFSCPKGADYCKFIQPASRFALVGAFVARYQSGYQVAVTGAAQDGVFRWTEAEEALTSNQSSSALDDLTVSEDDMISDMHGPAPYRAHLVKVLTGRAVAQAM